MPHHAALALVAATLADAEDDWWLVGGAAVALQGLDMPIADIDVLMSRRDIGRVIARLGIAPVEGVAIDRIRSEVWARWTAPPLVVDFMTGLQAGLASVGCAWRPARARRLMSADGRSTCRRVLN